MKHKWKYLKHEIEFESNRETPKGLTKAIYKVQIKWEDIIKKHTYVDPSIINILKNDCEIYLNKHITDSRYYLVTRIMHNPPMSPHLIITCYRFTYGTSDDHEVAQFIDGKKIKKQKNGTR